ncbi:protocadherin-15-like [Hoplias malabaricus]|uniref:protocadherin-15-like n=1 Tax=Hoplias malabaricus TaxID=27720 RepID=UPI003462F709
MLQNNLCKSENNITFLCDLHPFIHENPLYQEVTSRSPDPSIKGHRQDSFRKVYPVSPWSERFFWSFPSHSRGSGIYVRRQALWDPSQWKGPEEGLKLELKDSREELDVDMELLNGRNTKLSVREQARQFEQQAQAERTPRASLDLDDLLATISPPYSPMSVGKDVPPCILITASDGETPPLAPAQRPTPPVLRKFSNSISSYVTVEPCEVQLEIIADVPDTPPPSPHATLIVFSPPTVGAPPDALSLSPPPTTPTVLPPSPPPIRPTVYSPPFSHCSLSPPPLLRISTPPPLVAPPFLLSPVRDVLAKLRPVPLESEGLRLDLRGILRYSHNEGGLSKSTSTCYSPTDRNHTLDTKKGNNMILTEPETESEEEQLGEIDSYSDSSAEDLDSANNSSGSNEHIDIF